MISFIFGLLAMVLGAWGALVWRAELLMFLKGFLPISLFLSGVLAVIVGIASFSSSSRVPPGGKDAA
jgi:hypothetical protein